MSSLIETHLGSARLSRRGKVRELYDLGDALLLVASDRISAFDCVLTPGIPDKGKILTQLSNFWFRKFPEIENHLIETDVARFYLAGSGWQEYKQTRRVCGIRLPEGLVEASQLTEPIFTPATKSEKGHDENIPFERM